MIASVNARRPVLSESQAPAQNCVAWYVCSLFRVTNRLPTKTAFGYQTPFEGVYAEVPDLSLLRVWGCKTYLKIPKNYLRKDWREKCTSGYLMGYSTEGEITRFMSPSSKKLCLASIVHLMKSFLLIEKNT